MLALEFITWWYGQGWLAVIRHAGRRITLVAEAFSISTLLRTLFSPWRRIISYAGSGLEAHFHAAIDNAVSRFIGFLIRLTALLAASLMALLAGAVAIVMIAVWPLLPLLAIFLIIWGIA